MTKAQKAVFIRAVLDTARGEIGVREIGKTNRGRRVDEYQRADTLPGVGYPWCASYSGWTMLTTLGRELCDTVWLRSASCDQILYWGRRKGIVSPTPTLGAFGLVMASRNDATHIFQNEAILENAVQTIEGNTNAGGSREGIGVFRRRRVLTPGRYLFLDWTKLLPDGATLPGQKTAPQSVKIPDSPFDGAPLRELYLGGQLAASVPVIDGKSWLPAWRWAKWMNDAELGWNPATQTVTIAGRDVGAQPILHESRAWLPVLKLAEFSGLKAVYNPAISRIEISRAAAVGVK